MTDLTAGQIVEQLRIGADAYERLGVQDTADDRRMLATLIEQQADLIEADGKRLALADTAPHSPGCYSHIDSSLSYCTCWKADYDAAKVVLHE